MNPAFVLLAIIAVIAIWFLASWLYKPIGRFFYRIGHDAMEEMKIEEDD